MIDKASSSSYPVEKMCETLEVSRSGYYDWTEREPSKRQKENNKILEVMKASHVKAEGMIGLDKLWCDVKDAGFNCGRNRAYKLQKNKGFIVFGKNHSVYVSPIRITICQRLQTF